MKNIITVLVLMGVIGSVNADDFKYGIRLGVATKHFESTYRDDDGTRKKYNEDNRYVGYYIRDGHEFYEVGTFVNSFDQRSYYLGAGTNVASYKKINFGLFGGFVYGYQDTPINTPFLLGASIGTKYKNIDANITINRSFMMATIGLDL